MLGLCALRCPTAEARALVKSVAEDEDEDKLVRASALDALSQTRAPPRDLVLWACRAYEFATSATLRSRARDALVRQAATFVSTGGGRCQRGRPAERPRSLPRESSRASRIDSWRPFGSPVRDP